MYSACVFVSSVCHDWEQEAGTAGVGRMGWACHGPAGAGAAPGARARWPSCLRARRLRLRRTCCWRHMVLHVRLRAWAAGLQAGRQTGFLLPAGSKAGSCHLATASPLQHKVRCGHLLPSQPQKPKPQAQFTIRTCHNTRTTSNNPEFKESRSSLQAPSSIQPLSPRLSSPLASQC